MTDKEILEELEAYLKDSYLYQSDINTYFNRTELGKYILETVGEENLPKTIRAVRASEKEDYGEIKQTNNSLGIGFFCYLTFDDLKRMFDIYICHSDFGEGFDEDEDLWGGKYLGASFFVNSNNVKFHVHRDHRGTQFEVYKNTTKDELLNGLKGIVDIYKKTKNDNNT